MLATYGSQQLFPSNELDEHTTMALGSYKCWATTEALMPAKMTMNKAILSIHDIIWRRVWWSLSPHPDVKGQHHQTTMGDRILQHMFPSVKKMLTTAAKHMDRINERAYIE